MFLFLTVGDYIINNCICINSSISIMEYKNVYKTLIRVNIDRKAIYIQTISEKISMMRLKKKYIIIR